jgi:TrmH family RNA methyltransferase
MPELSINKLKYLTSLHQKKTREEEGVFIAEGIKVINDLVKFGFIPQLIAYNPQTWDLKDFGQSHAFCEYFTVTNQQAEKMSLLSTAPGVLAVFPKPVYEYDLTTLKAPYVFLLDGVNDPGNLGTIIRTAHWYGITDIFITKGSSEIFGPKVVQSSMGSLAAIKVHVIDNELFKNQLKEIGTSIIVADMDGSDIRSGSVNKPACIVFGSEANGLSDFWKNSADSAFSIVPVNRANHPESLNLSISTAIFMELLTR